MKKILIFTLLTMALVSSTAFYVFPNIPSFAPLLPGFSEQLVMAFSFIILIPQLVAIWAFLSSLGAFKEELKPVYYILALGILLLSVNQLQLPITSFIVVDPIVLSWIITLSTLAGALFTYLSMHRLSKVLDMRTKFWGSLIPVTLLSLTLAVLSSFIPHEPYGVSELTLDSIFGVYIAGGAFAAAAGILVWNIKSKIADKYKVGMKWLAAAAFALGFACFHETLIRLVPIFSQEGFGWYFLYGASLWPLFLVSVFLLCASLSFKKISDESSELPENASHIDVINYVAQLVSNPKTMDVALDKVRAITALKGPGDEFSSADKKELLGVYKQFETYLTTKEPLLRLTKEELRSRLPESFRQQIDSKA